jgi:hypothetical protein
MEGRIVNMATKKKAAKKKKH